MIDLIRKGDKLVFVGVPPLTHKWGLHLLGSGAVIVYAYGEETVIDSQSTTEAITRGLQLIASRAEKETRDLVHFLQGRHLPFLKQLIEQAIEDRNMELAKERIAKVVSAGELCGLDRRDGPRIVFFFTTQAAQARIRSLEADPPSVTFPIQKYMEHWVTLVHRATHLSLIPPMCVEINYFFDALQTWLSLTED